MEGQEQTIGNMTTRCGDGVLPWNPGRINFNH